MNLLCFNQSIFSKTDCDRPCIELYRPHCGSDGKTYGNKCEFERGKCKNPGLTLVKIGKCERSKHGIPRNDDYTRNCS